MVFERAEVAGGYLGRYLTGGQLERFLAAADRSWQPLWVSPTLLHQSGWSLERCPWIRQAWHVQKGTWRGSKGPFGGLSTRLPSWWFRPDDRAWVLAVMEPGATVTAEARGSGPAGECTTSDVDQLPSC
jgi:hypothetical protein